MLEHSLFYLEGVAQNIHQCCLPNDIHNKKTGMFICWFGGFMFKIKWRFWIQYWSRRLYFLIPVCVVICIINKSFPFMLVVFFHLEFVLLDCNKRDEMKLHPVINVRKHLGVTKTFVPLKANSTKLMSKSNSTCSKSTLTDKGISCHVLDLCCVVFICLRLYTCHCRICFCKDSIICIVVIVGVDVRSDDVVFYDVI